MRIAVTLVCGFVLFGCGEGGSSSSDGAEGGSGGSTGGSSGSGGTAGSGGSAGSGGTAGAPGSGGSGGSGGTAGSGGSAGTGGGCDPKCESGGFTCCGSTCVNPFNDINNCGTCGNKCSGPNPFCAQGTCGKAPCAAGSSCGEDNCCGTQCCGADELCCDVPTSVSQPASCTPRTEEGTCPLGCLQCVCASPDTPIATPTGQVPIASLAIGDLVYSVHQCRLVVVPLKRVNRTPVQNHKVMRILLEDGTELRISGGHPTADGRLLSNLSAEDQLGGLQVRSIEPAAYHYSHTYDILPDSDSGAYFAGGVLMGSTLAHPTADCAASWWSTP